MARQRLVTVVAGGVLIAAGVLAGEGPAGAIEVGTGAAFVAAWADGSVTEIVLTADIEVDCVGASRGFGAAAIVVDGAGHTITEVCAPGDPGGGTIQSQSPATLTDLTVLGPTGPFAATLRGNSLTLDDIRVVGRNDASTIQNLGGEILITDSVIETEGAGFGLESDGAATLQRTRITGTGSGVYTSGGDAPDSLAIVDSSIDVDGTGVTTEQPTVIERSSIRGDVLTLTTAGGDVSVITDTTLVVGPGDDGPDGGAVRIAGATEVLFDQVTVVPDDPTAPGLVPAVRTINSRLTVHASVLMGRAGQPVCAGPVLSAGDSVAGDDTCGLAGPDDQVVAGGGLETYDPDAGFALPVIDGPLMDAVDACTSTGDQRGEPRPSGPACDIGAIEIQVPEPPPTSSSVPAGPPPAAPPATPVPGPARFTG
jgi:hypothetical protein